MKFLYSQSAVIKKIVLAILICLPAAARAQHFFIQLNSGYNFPTLIKSRYEGSLRSSVPIAGSIGITTKGVEGGITLSKQTITEKAHAGLVNRNILVPGAASSPGAVPVTVYRKYGNTLLTMEAFMNAKLLLDNVRVLAGASGGLIKTTGPKEGLFTTPYPYAHTIGDVYRSYGQCKGFVLGLQTAVLIPIFKGLSADVSVACKYIHFKTKADNIYYLQGEQFQFTLIPITAGLRYTF